MKKPKNPIKLSKPALPQGLKQSFRRESKQEKKAAAALDNAPRITNDTVADHREQVLRSARKYIYPLQHSKQRVVRTSIALFVAVVIGFFAYCGLSLYKLNATSRFMYAVTQVIPFPVAKAGDRWVSYESYLFELRRNMHYYQTQQQANFKTKDGAMQLDRLEKQALDQVVRDAYIKELADKNGVRVTTDDVNSQLAIVRSQNRLGSNDRVFRDVLNEFWGWDENDFKRELRQQLLQQAVASKLDTETHTKAATALKELKTLKDPKDSKSGGDFAAVAAKYSDDISTKGTGGNYAIALTPGNKDIAPALGNALTKLSAGQVSDVVDAGYTLEILKVIDKTPANTMHAAHIQFTLKPVTTYVKPLQTKQPTKYYIQHKA